jgi:hypothetical protein
MGLASVQPWMNTPSNTTPTTNELLLLGQTGTVQFFRPYCMYI